MGRFGGFDSKKPLTALSNVVYYYQYLQFHYFQIFEEPSWSRAGMANLDSSYRWLQRRPFPFPLALDLLLKQVRQASQEAKKSRLAKNADQVLQVADRVGDRLERAVARVECAVAYASVASDDEARDLLEDGIELLHPSGEVSRDYKHYYAVANWLVGELLGGSPEQRVKVILAWQACLDQFENLVFHPANITGEERWYRQRYQEMHAKIEEFINREETAAGAKTGAAYLPAKEWPTAVLYTGGHRVLEVIAKIPAGGFGPGGRDPYCEEKIDLKAEMDSFHFSGIDHSMFNLRGPDRVIRLNSAQTYFLLQVTGDSMDRAGIEAGDYVLIREQVIAEDGEIVAAGVRSELDLATLKRYRGGNGSIILTPESTNPAWVPQPFSRQDLIAGIKDWKFLIHGIALAVLKPTRTPEP